VKRTYQPKTAVVRVCTVFVRVCGPRVDAVCSPRAARVAASASPSSSAAAFVDAARLRGTRRSPRCGAKG